MHFTAYKATVDRYYCTGIRSMTSFQVFEAGQSFFGVFTTSNTKGEFESAVCQFSFKELDQKFTTSLFEEDNGKKTKNWDSYRNDANEAYLHPYDCSSG